MSAQELRDECLSASWLAERLAVDPGKIDAMRRAGDLIALRDEESSAWLYPTWQLDGREPRRVVARVVAAAREAGMDESELYRVLTGRLGLRGDSRLVDLVRAGRDDEVVAAVRSARPS